MRGTLFIWCLALGTASGVRAEDPSQFLELNPLVKPEGLPDSGFSPNEAAVPPSLQNTEESEPVAELPPPPQEPETDPAGGPVLTGPAKSVPQELGPVLPPIEQDAAGTAAATGTADATSPLATGTADAASPLATGTTDAASPLAPRLASPVGVPTLPSPQGLPAPAPGGTATSDGGNASGNGAAPTASNAPEANTASGPTASPLPPGKPAGTFAPVAESEITGPEFAIILANSRFHPSRIKVKAGTRTNLLFTTVNPKPAALIIEKLKVQTWIPAQGTQPAREPTWEVNRELGANRITQIELNPEPGTYLFHDAITGASGEIVVE